MSNADSEKFDISCKNHVSALRDIHQAALLFFNNQINDAEQLTIDKTIENPECAHSYANLWSANRLIMATFTNEKKIIEDALKKVEEAKESLRKTRKRSQSVTESLLTFFGRIDYETYNDIECLCEVESCEANVIAISLTFMADQSFMSLIRAGRSLFSSYQFTKLMMEIHKNKKNWHSEELRKEFTTGVNMCWGIVNFLSGSLPKKVIKLIGILGIVVDKPAGIEMLREASADMTAGYRAVGSAFIVCILTFYVEVLLGLGDVDMEWIKSLVTKKLELCPNGSFDLMFAARYHQITGNNSKAIELFEKSIKFQREFIEQRNAARWDLLWCYAMNCKWSPATNCYQYACFLLMIAETESKPELMSEVEQAMRSVEKLRTRCGGKTLPPEKFAITMANRYCNRIKGHEIQLPALMLFYIWNVFGNCVENPSLMTPILTLIDERHQNLDKSSDQYFVLLLLKGVCLRNSEEPQEALEKLSKRSSSSRKKSKWTHVASHAAMEMGLTLIDLGRYEDAEFWLERARDRYSKFLIETIVHIRIHGALQKLERLIKHNNN